MKLSECWLGRVVAMADCSGGDNLDVGHIMGFEGDGDTAGNIRVIVNWARMGKTAEWPNVLLIYCG